MIGLLPAPPRTIMLLAVLLLGLMPGRGEAAIQDDFARREGLLCEALQRSPRSIAAFERWRQLWLDERDSQGWLERAQALSQDPRASSAWIATRVAASLDLREEAEGFLRLLLQRADQDPSAWILAGSLAERWGQPDRALESWRKALGLGPSLDELRPLARDMALAHVQGERPEEAIALLRDLQRRHPEEARFQAELAEIADDAGLDQLALELWSPLCDSEAGPDLRFQAEMGRSRIWLDAQQHEPLRRALSAALDGVDAEDWRADRIRQRLEASYRRSSEEDVWLGRLEQRSRQGGSPASARAWIDAVMRLRGPAEADAALDLALQRFPADLGLREFAIEQHVQLGRWAEAHRLALDAARLDPSPVRWQRAAEIALRPLDDPELLAAGMQHCRRSLELDDRPEVALAAARLLLEAAQRRTRALEDEAATRLQTTAQDCALEALRRRPEDPGPLLLLAEHRARIGDREGAVEWATRSLQAPRGSAEDHRSAVRFLTRLDAIEPAAACAAAGLALRPDLDASAALVEWCLDHERAALARPWLEHLVDRARAEDRPARCVDLLLRAGRDLQTLDQWARDWRRRAQEDPEDSLTLWLLAASEQAAGHIETAVALYQQVLALRPGDDVLTEALLDTVALSSTPQRAGTLLRQWAQRWPGRRPQYWKRAITIELSQGQVDSALQLARQLAEQTPGDAGAQALLAEACFVARQPEEGLRALRRCVHRDPGDLVRRAELARRLLEAAPTRPLLWAEADEQWFEILLRSPDAPLQAEAMQRLREIASARGRDGDLIERLRGARDRLGNTPELVAMMARVQLEQGKTPQAVNALDEALLRHPGHPSLLELRFDIARQQEDWALAAKLQSLRLELGQQLPSWAQVVELYERAGRDDEARRRWDGLLDTRDGAGLASLAIEEWIAEGEVERARRWALRASQRRPEDPRLLLLAGALLLAAGEVDAARPRFLTLARQAGSGPMPVRESAPEPGLGVEALRSFRLESFQVTGTAVFTEQTLPTPMAGSRVRVIAGSSAGRAPTSWTSAQGERPLGGLPPWPPLPELWPNLSTGPLARQLRELATEPPGERGTDLLASMALALRRVPDERLASVAALVCFQSPIGEDALGRLRELRQEFAGEPLRLLPFAHAAFEARAWPLLSGYCEVLDREPGLRSLSAGLRLRCLDGRSSADSSWPPEFVDALARDLERLQGQYPGHAAALRQAVVARASLHSERELLRAVWQRVLAEDSSPATRVEALWSARAIGEPLWTADAVQRLEAAAAQAPREAAFLIAHQLLVHGGPDAAEAAQEVFLAALARPVKALPRPGRLVAYQDAAHLVEADFSFPEARAELPAEALLFLHRLCCTQQPALLDAFRARLEPGASRADPVALALARMAMRWFLGDADGALNDFERFWARDRERVDLALLTARGAVLAFDPQRAARALQWLDPDSPQAVEARAIFEWMRKALFSGPPESVLEAVGLELRFARPEPVLDALFPHWSQPQRPRNGPLAIVRAMHDRPRGRLLADRLGARLSAYPDHHDLRLLDLLFRDARGLGTLEAEARAWFEHWREKPAGYGSPMYADLVEALLTRDPASLLARELAGVLAERTDSEADLRGLFVLQAESAVESSLPALVQQTAMQLGRLAASEPLPEAWRGLRQARWLTERLSELSPPTRRRLLALVVSFCAQAHLELGLWTPLARDLSSALEADWGSLSPEARRRALRGLRELLFVEGSRMAPAVEEDRLDPRGRHEGFVREVLDLAAREAQLDAWREQWADHPHAADAEMLRLRLRAARRAGDTEQVNALARRLRVADGWREAYEQGRTLLSLGRLGDAAQALSGSLQSCREDSARSRVLLAQGIAGLHGHDIGDARELLEAAVQADVRRSAEVAWALMTAPAPRRDLATAGRHLRWALEHEAHRPRTLRAAALLFLRTGTPTRALRALQRLDEVRILDDPPLAERLLRVLVQLELGQRREAEREALMLQERVGPGIDPEWRELAREWIARVGDG